ncbi:MAG TPA: ribonuclease P protein component [Mycobacteriales bacterium]
MLPRSARLHRGRDIARVSSQGSRAHSGGISVSVVVGDEPTARATVVVSRRSGGAVARNRQRRRIRHALVPTLQRVPAGAELVVRGGPRVAQLPPAELASELDRAVRRALRRVGS